jgi:hypothetical protein
MPTIRPINTPAIPLEFRLPVVQDATVEQYDFRPPDFEAQLQEFTGENRRLLQWIRAEATRLFPDDLIARKAAISLSLGALSLTQNQQLHDTLSQHFDEDVPPAAA